MAGGVSKVWSFEGRETDLYLIPVKNPIFERNQQMAGIKGKSGGARANAGGARRGAGRKRGTRNPRTIARAAAARLLPFNADPLQWLLAVMTDTRQDLRLRVHAARAAMPYVHARP